MFTPENLDSVNWIGEITSSCFGSVYPGLRAPVRAPVIHQVAGVCFDHSEQNRQNWVHIETGSQKPRSKTPISAGSWEILFTTFTFV